MDNRWLSPLDSVKEDFIMKKVLVVLLVCFVATGAFAQFSVQGQAMTHFGLQMPLEDFEFDNANWMFRWLDAGTWLQVTGEHDVASGWIRYRADNAWRGNATVNMGNVALSMGHVELPWVRWGRLAFLNNNMASFGASNSTVNPYIFVRTMGFYAGLTEAGKFTNIGSLGQSIGEGGFFPGFYAGYDITLGDIGLGFAFAGISTREDFAVEAYENKGVFPFMGNVFARLNNLGPVNLNVNLGFYGDPQFGFFGVSRGWAGSVARRGAGDDALIVLEGMIDLQVPFEGGRSLGVIASMITNFESNRDDLGMRIAAQFVAPLGTRFDLIPGVLYQTIVNGDTSELIIACTLRFAF